MDTLIHSSIACRTSTNKCSLFETVKWDHRYTFKFTQYGIILFLLLIAPEWHQRKQTMETSVKLFSENLLSHCMVVKCTQALNHPPSLPNVAVEDTILQV